MMLKRIAVHEIGRTRFDPIDEPTRAGAAAILSDVRERGEAAVREHAERLGDIKPGAPLVIERAQLAAALAGLPKSDRETLERTAERITAFAEAQRRALAPVDIAVESGRAGHEV